MEKISYDNFIENTGLKEINFYNLDSFSELCLILYSCKLFIGNFSSPLSLAFAMHIPCIVAQYSDRRENKLFENLNKLLPSILTII
jgi:ADP-heptose:LPS heptosyltransferase